MPSPTTAEQSVRRSARQAAVAAQARRRAKTAERDKRLEAASINLVVAVHERDAAEHRAAAAIAAMVDEGLALADVVAWCDGETSLKEVTRLTKLTTRPGAGS